MAVAADVFQITHVQTYYSQILNNVYFYIRNPASGASAQYLCDLFIATVVPEILAIQPSNIVTTAVRCQNLFDPLDTGETLLNLAGTLSGGGQILPPFIAAEFVLDRDSSVVRNGRKRVAAGTENQMTGSVWDGSFLAGLQAAADAMLENLVTGLFVDAYPFIVKRILDLVTGDYRLPTTAAEADGALVVDVLYDPEVTTQNSRKIGNGS